MWPKEGATTTLRPTLTSTSTTSTSTSTKTTLATKGSSSALPSWNRLRSIFCVVFVWSICFSTVFFGMDMERRYLHLNKVDHLEAQVRSLLQEVETLKAQGGSGGNNKPTSSTSLRGGTTTSYHGDQIPIIIKEDTPIPTKSDCHNASTKKTKETNSESSNEKKVAIALPDSSRGQATTEKRELESAEAKPTQPESKASARKLLQEHKETTTESTEDAVEAAANDGTNDNAGEGEDTNQGSMLGPIVKDNQDHPTFPETKFTPHVREVIETIDNVTLHLPEEAANPWWYQPQKYCPQGQHIYVDKPYSPPTAIECHPDVVWCGLLRKIFSDPNRILPYNVSIGTSSADMIKKGTMSWGQCLGSSAPKGLFSMNNFQDAKAMMETNTKTNDRGYTFVHTKTWGERSKIPVFRGNARIRDSRGLRQNPQQHCAKKTIQNGQLGHRSKAVLFSLEHPDLLDARVSAVKQHPCMMYNTTNGMDQVAGVGKYHRDEQINIPSSEYYTNYQTALVLGGIGAAFRASEHFAAGQLVVLQRFTYEEWWYPYLIPYEHYIPIKNDLSDMKEALEFVKHNPQKVKRIAENGKKFYEEWLSFPQTTNHWHEMLWRLSEMIHEKGPERIKMGSLRTLWPAPIIPQRFLRDKDTGAFTVREDRDITSKPYEELDAPPEEDRKKGTTPEVDKKVVPQPEPKPTKAKLEEVPSAFSKDILWQSEHLPLLPWEEASITGKCEPPEGIPRTCCARTTTKGSGQPVEFRPELCTTEMGRYRNVETKVLEFLKQHPIVGDDAVGCDVCRIVQVMQQQNWTTLVMTGDSMSRQTFEGFKCELFRRGYDMDVKFERPFGKDPNVKGFKYGIREKTTLTLSTTATTPLKIIFYIMYYPTPKSIQQFMVGPHDEGADVLIFDHTLWYRHWETDLFQDVTMQELEAINNGTTRPPKMVFWREQTSQHWATPGGQYSPGYNSSTVCQPLDQNTDWYRQNYFHLNSMRNVTRDLGVNFIESTNSSTTLSTGSTNLHFIPYRDFTSQFHDIHRKGECTHFCSTPDIWLPISRMLRLHMDNYVRVDKQ